MIIYHSPVRSSAFAIRRRSRTRRRFPFLALIQTQLRDTERTGINFRHRRLEDAPYPLQTQSHLRGRQSGRRRGGRKEEIKYPNRRRTRSFSSDEHAPLAERSSTEPHRTSSVQSEEGAGVSTRTATTAQSQVDGDSGALTLRAKAKRIDKIAISRDDVRAKPLPDDHRAAIGTDSSATLPSRVDGRSPESRKRTIMARYVFGDELKPGERWKRRLLTSR